MDWIMFEGGWLQLAAMFDNCSTIQELALFQFFVEMGLSTLTMVM